MSARSLAVFTGSQNESTAIRARQVTGLSSADVLTFARQSDDYLFPFAAGDIGALYTPLPPSRFDAIVVEQSCELFAGTTTVDWLAHMVNSLTLGGRIFLSSLKPDQGAKLARAEPSASLASLGLAPSLEGAWVVASRPPGWEAPKVNSVLGAYLQGRGDFVMNAVLGGAVRRAAASRLEWFLGGGTLADPDAPLNLARYDREDLIRIVERCRAGEIQQGDVEEGVERRDIDAVAFKESAGRLAAHMKSWQTYVMYGTAYKAASITPVLRREFGNRPIKFLEHGGYAGSLSMQLLADLPSMQKLGVVRSTLRCCPTLNCSSNACRVRFQTGSVSLLRALRIMRTSLTST